MAVYGKKKKGDEVAVEIRKQYKLRRERMQTRHMRWLEVLHAIHGDQNKVMRNGQLIDMARIRPQEVEHIEVTHNYLYQTFRVMVASVLQSAPAPVVSLGRVGRDSKAMARACERLLEWFYYDKKYKDATRHAVAWTFTCGIGFMGTMWDMLADPPTWLPKMDKDGNVIYKEKKELMLDKFGELMHSEFGTPLTETVMVPQGEFKLLGDLRFFAPSPFDVYPEQARSWTDVRNCIMRQYAKKEDLVSMFGSKAKDLQPDVRSDDFVRFDNYGEPDERNDGEDLVLVLSYCELPSKSSPAGKYCIVAGNKLLHEADLPGGKLPISPIYDTEHPAHLWGESSIRQALSVQRDLNVAEADLKMDRRMHAHPRLVCEQGSLVRGTTRVPNVPGAVLEVRSNARMTPQFFQGPGIPAWMERSPGRLRQTIEDVTGAHGLSKGEQGGIMSGRQASVVLAADRQKWGPTISSLAAAVEHCSSLALSLWREHGPIETTIDVYGSLGSPTDIMVFARDYIGDNIKVHIDASNMMPYNEELRRQQVVELWQTGAIPDQKMLWKLLRHGEMGRMLGTDEPSRARARQENDLLDKGLQVNVEQHEDHGAHMDEHLERMRDPSWYDISPQGQQSYRMHMAQHSAYVQNAANPVLAGQSQMPGLAAGQNMPPTMNGVDGAQTMPGLSLVDEAAGGAPWQTIQ